MEELTSIWRHLDKQDADLMLTRDTPIYDLAGLIDIHIHTAPDVAPRLVNDLEAAQDARIAGMRAILIKSHVTCTADRAAIAEKVIGSIRVFGGLALNEPAGGLNPAAVDAALRLGAKMIWMPTRDATHNRQVKGHSGGIFLLTAEGKLVPEINPILELIRDAGAVLSTGHVSVPEIIALVRQARRMNLRKILITHPESRSVQMPQHIQQQLAGEGVFLERCFLPVANGQTSVDELIANIRAVGVASTVLATDFGQVGNPRPVDGLCAFLSQIESKGVSKQDIAQMTGQTPAYLLDL